MAGSSLLALIDDIATLLDDVAILTKVAANKSVAAMDDVAVLTKIASQKTAGVLGDDLALNAQQVTGVAAEREIPVVWAVAKGSFVNKAILVPAALLISAIAPWAVTPLLMIGGAFLCFEGFEKLAHKFLHTKHEEAEEHARLATALVDTQVDLVAFEKEKIQGAVRTDFILSAEIIAITLGTVATQPFMTQVTVLSLIALVMTVGVYGFVGAIVKLDDLGIHLQRKPGTGVGARLMRGAGSTILKAAPFLMRFLSVAGTAAMFLVGGGILAHGIGPLHHWTEEMGHGSGVVAAVGPMLVNALVGVVAGGIVVGVVTLAARMRGKKPAH